MAQKQKYVLWQTPNLPIIVWFIGTVLGRLFQQGTIHQILSLVSFGALFTWAWLEVFYGANDFRRGLGAAVLVFSIYTRVN